MLPKFCDSDDSSKPKLCQEGMYPERVNCEVKHAYNDGITFTDKAIRVFIIRLENGKAIHICDLPLIDESINNVTGITQNIKNLTTFVSCPVNHKFILRQRLQIWRRGCA